MGPLVKLFLLAALGQQDSTISTDVPWLKNTTIDPALVPPEPEPDPEGGEDTDAGHV